MAQALDVGSVLLTAGAGSGKTTLLEEALSEGQRSVAWVSCVDTDRAPGILLLRILDAISSAAPGASDVLAEQLAVAQERVDALAATRELLADLPKLLLEPLNLVIDDAEQLEGAEESLLLISEFVGSEHSLVHVAIASRCSLDLRVAKPRATGRLSELRASDLAFDAEECAELLRSKGGRNPSPEEVDAVMEATEGWPLGVVLAVSHGEGAQRDLRSLPEVGSYLSEELLESLDPELREAAISSSVARHVTSEVAAALDLPADFGQRVERAGMLVRRVDDQGTFAYHPLLRELLLARLDEERGEEEVRRLHGTVAPVVAAAGDPIGATQHLLEARDWPEAVAAIERAGPALARTSPELLKRWLSLLPDEVQGQATLRALAGQLEWLAGNNQAAIDAFHQALDGFRAEPNAPAEWIARSMLLDLLFATGQIDELDDLVAGWDQPAAQAAGGIAAAAAMFAAGVLAAFGRFEDSDRLASAARREGVPDLLASLETLRFLFLDVPRGHLDEACSKLEAATDGMKRSDPLHRRNHVLGALAAALGDRGQREEALQLWLEIREGARGGVAAVLADATHAWCALLHAQAGRLAEAEAELAQHRRQESGARAFIGELALTAVAALRGDAAGAVTGAERTLEVIAPGPILMRCWAAGDLAPALASVGRADRASEVVDDALALVEESFEGSAGCFLEGRFLALRAWLAHTDGDGAAAEADLALCWERADESLPHVLRREWERVEPVVWQVLERGVLDPMATIAAIGDAFPSGLELVPFLDHPVAEVRKAAIPPSVRSGDPEALDRLKGLQGDAHPDVAAAASQAIERLARTLPPLRFELLGRFAVGRGAWRAGDSWHRPVDARLVRFLLVNLDRPVPEDAIFEALWPDLDSGGARKSLQVAVSRARRVIDPPGTECSAIESIDRTYRLILGERDGVDAEAFRSAAETALAETDGGRRALLERARSLWAGEPLPEERYSDWTTDYRERLIDRYTAVLAALVGMHEAAGEHVEAAEVARELVDLDELNEGGHRALITAYARSGRTGYALRQYLECRRELVEQLGIEPSEETSRLQARILAGEAV